MLNTATMPNHKNGDSIKFLVGASILSFVIWSIPLAWILVYPLRLFVTFIHEGGHALAALLTSGSVERVIIYPNASGETYTRSGLQLVIASAGYLTSAIFGAGLLIMSRQGTRSKTVLTITAAAILALTAFFTSDPISLGLGIVLTIGLIWIAIASSPRFAHFFLSFLAIQCCLNALFDLRTLFLLSAHTNVQSDAMTMELLTGLPAIAWATLWLGISVALLIVALIRR
jgi:hypothetical protein